MKKIRNPIGTRAPAAARKRPRGAARSSRHRVPSRHGYCPQHDKAVGENCHEHAEHKLIGSIAHEIAQDARGVLRRGGAESVTMVIEKRHPATVIIELAMAVSMPRAPSAPALSRGCQLFAASVSAKTTSSSTNRREHDSGEDEQRLGRPSRGGQFDPSLRSMAAKVRQPATQVTSSRRKGLFAAADAHALRRPGWIARCSSPETSRAMKALSGMIFS